MQIVVTKAYKFATINEDAQNTLNSLGMTLLEQAFSGPYEVYLFNDSRNDIKQIGLQTNQTQCADFAIQHQRLPAHEDACNVNLDYLQQQIKSWQDKYGKLYIGSMNPRKTHKYANILRRLGFEVHTDKIMGYDVYYI
jgi:hypothetical protein